MSERRALFVLAVVAASAAACAPASAPPTTTVALELAAPPARVVSLAVSVLDVERDRIVASATVATPRTSFLLGVPAEVPIELRVVARTALPGPAAIGGMPAYYGAIRRTIPLGRDQERIAIRVHPAGVLTLEADLLPRGVLYRDELPLRLDGVALELGPDGLPIDPRALGTDTADELSVPFILAPGDRDRPRRTRSFVLRAGRWSAALALEDPEPDDPALTGGRGLWIAPEGETVAHVDLTPEPAPVDPNAPAALQLALIDATGRALEPPDVVPIDAPPPGPLAVVITAVDAEDRPLAGPVAAEVTLGLTAEPDDVLSMRPPADERSLSLPDRLYGLVVAGRGRVHLVARARLADGRTIFGDLGVNALGAADVPGVVADVRLGVSDLGSLATGTRCTVELLDARGLYAQRARGVLDLSASDPWITLGAQPDVEASPTRIVTAADRGVLRFPFARPSGPRGAPAILRATFTATTARSYDASMALPILEVTP